MAGNEKKFELNLEEMERIVGGSGSTGNSSLTPEEISSLLSEAWQLKKVNHLSMQEVIDQLSKKVQADQQAALAAIIDQYCDFLN